MTKTVKWILVGVTVLVVAGLVIIPKVSRGAGVAGKEPGAVQPGGRQQKVLQVHAEVLASHLMTDKTVTTGNILPAEEVDLSFETSGKVVAIYFTEGEFVKKGTLLAKINDAPLQAQLKKLEAQVKLAQDRVYRQQTLLERDAVSQETYEAVLTEYNKLQADIELVKAQIDQTELKAPFDGVIGLRQLSEGAYANSSTKVASLAQVSELKIDFSVPESYAGEVKRGTPITFSLQDDQGRSRSFHANVYAVEAGVNRETRTLNVRALYSNKDRSLIPGRYISVEITRKAIVDALSVPAEAIIPEMGQYVVYLYNGGQAKPVIITAGMRTESRVQVLGGLCLGDTVLTSGVMQLRKGSRVALDQVVLTQEGR